MRTLFLKTLVSIILLLTVYAVSTAQDKWMNL